MTIVDLKAIRQARALIDGYVRLSPVLEVVGALEPPTTARLILKLDNLQPTGSFKVRGAVNTLLSLEPVRVARGLITASGGNHGLAVAYAARIGGSRAIVYLPRSAAPEKSGNLRHWGAEVVIEGDVFDEAAAAAKRRADSDDLTFVHPFAPQTVIAGQGTLGLEIVDQIADVGTVIVAVGGGGLIAGAATAIKALRPSTRVIGVEPVGAPTHYESRRAGGLVTLEAIATAAGSLAPKRSEPINFDLISAHVDDIVLVDDDAMRTAASWLWLECGIATELAGAASLAALQSGAVTLRDGEIVCAVICGAGTDGIG